MTSQSKWREFFKQAGILKKNAHKYAKLFDNNSISFELLTQVNDVVLSELGINNTLDKSKILQRLEQKVHEVQDVTFPEVIEHCEVTLESGSSSSTSLKTFMYDSLNVFGNDATITGIPEEYAFAEEKYSQRKKRRCKQSHIPFNNKDESNSNRKCSNKKKKRKWTEEDMEQALTAIRQDGITLTASAKKYNIPRQTLHDRLHCKYNSNRYGRPTCLSVDEEELLLDFISYKNTIHEPLNITEIRLLATAIAKENGRENRFKKKGAGHAWWQCFRKRHENRLKFEHPSRFQKGKSIRTPLSVLKRNFDSYVLTLYSQNRILESRTDKYAHLTTQDLNPNQSNNEITNLLVKVEEMSNDTGNTFLINTSNTNHFIKRSEADIFEESSSESDLCDDSDDDSDSSTSSDEESEYTDDEKTDLCATCLCEKPAGSTKKQILWIFCEQCEHWYHVDCEGVTKKDLLKEKYICKKCQ